MIKFAKTFAIAASLCASAAFAEPPQWKLSESTGTVNVLRSGVSKIALAGGSINAGDIVQTGHKGRAVLVRGQEYVIVSPNSRLRISEPKKSGAIMQFFEEVGNVLYRIDKKATPHFGVETPYLAAVVKGTTFSVTVSESGSAVQVTEGAVQVTTLDGGATYLLTPGVIGIVSKESPYRLTITGAETRIIESPNAPDIEPGKMEAFEVAIGNYEGLISAPVFNKPVSLGGLTSGLVSNEIPAAVKIAVNSGSVLTAGTGTGVTIGTSSGASAEVDAGAGVTVGTGGGTTVGAGAGVTVGTGSGSAVSGGAGVTVGTGGGTAVSGGAGVTVGTGGGTAVSGGAGVTVGTGGGTAVSGGAGVTVGTGGGTAVSGGAGVTVGTGSGTAVSGGAGVTVGTGGGTAVGAGTGITVGKGGGLGGLLGKR